jgi:hypothetical protein
LTKPAAQAAARPHKAKAEAAAQAGDWEEF